MIAFLKKYMIPISLLVLLVVLWQFPTAINAIFVAILAISLTTAILVIFKKQREAYLQGKISRGVFVRATFLEIIGILLAMILAGLFGRYIAQVATAQIANDLIKLIAGIVIGLLAGMGVGVLVQRTWGRLMKISFERQ